MDELLSKHSQHAGPLDTDTLHAPTTTDMHAPPSLELTHGSIAVMPEIVEVKELLAQSCVDDKAQVTAESLADTATEDNKHQTASTCAIALNARTTAVPLLPSSWTTMRESAAIMPDTPDLGSSPPSPDKCSLWTSIRETADMLSATCSPALGCGTLGASSRQEPAAFISLVAALRRLEVYNVSECTDETSMVRYIALRIRREI